MSASPTNTFSVGDCSFQIDRSGSCARESLVLTLSTRKTRPISLVRDTLHRFTRRGPVGGNLRRRLSCEDSNKTPVAGLPWAYVSILSCETHHNKSLSKFSGPDKKLCDHLHDQQGKPRRIPKDHVYMVYMTVGT